MLLASVTRAVVVALIFFPGAALLAQQGGSVPPVPRSGFVQMPAEWVKEGFPNAVDVSRPIGNITPWAKFKSGLREHSAAKTLVLPRDYEMLQFLISDLPERNVEYYMVFTPLARLFARTAYQAQVANLLAPLLKREDLDVDTRIVVAWGLASLDAKDSVADMLPLLLKARGDDANLLRQSIRKLGYELPFEEEQPQPLH